MKKSAITLIAMAAVAASYAQTTVSSANIVGYVQTETPAAGAYNIISLVQFSDGSNTVHIQDAIANMDELNSSATWENADKLYVWNGMNYDQYGLFQPTEGPSYWADSGFPWIVGTCVASDAQLNRGEAVWYSTGTGASSVTATVSGDVFLDDTFVVTLSSTYSILSYPYSSSINLTNLVVSNATASASWETADKIHIFNGSNYDKYGLFQPTSGSPYWAESGFSWIVGTCTPADQEINMGQGFWYESPEGSKDIGFTSIYSID